MVDKSVINGALTLGSQFCASGENITGYAAVGQVEGHEQPMGELPLPVDSSDVVVIDAVRVDVDLGAAVAQFALRLRHSSVHFMNRRCRLRLVSAGERDDRGVRRLDQKVVGRRRPKGVQERLTAVVSQAERGTLPKRVRNE